LSMADKLKIEYVALDEVVRFARNPKQHDEPGITNSIERFDFNSALEYNEHPEATFLLAGHGRCKALVKMREAGDEPPGHIAKDKKGRWMVPIVRLNLPPGEAEAYSLAHNQLTVVGDPETGNLYDEEELAGLVADLDSRGVGLGGLGWSDEELSGMLTDAGGGPTEPPPEPPPPEINKAAELQEKWGTEPGQLWELGRHRAICGDCTDPSIMQKLCNPLRANLLFTSPPYWVGKDYETQQSESEIDTFILACIAAWTDNVHVDYGRIVINTGTAAIHRIEKGRKLEVLPLIDKWAHALKARGWLARHFRIWAKSGDLPASISAKSDVVDQRWEHLVTFEHNQCQHMYLCAFWKPDGEQRGQEQLGTPWVQQGVWSDIQGERSCDGLHVASFPVELPRRYIMTYTKVGEYVLDPFGGAGTTLLAAHQLKRVCFMSELDPRYVAVTLERWHQMTGEQPVLLDNAD